ncbi:MAG: glucan 1,4-alpha-glucosidase [Bacteroidetes bacterium]|nr:glucan 1,4-alpha-glucosidase [Bacteroidota bacterium]
MSKEIVFEEVIETVEVSQEKIEKERKITPIHKRHNEYAPGWPGITPRWTSAAKNGVGTAFNIASKVWFTMSHGTINEIYYPQVDQACTRDMEFIVTDGKDFFSEEKRNTIHQIENLEEGVPGFRIINTCKEGNYRIEKEVITDPHRDTFLQRIKFIPLKNDLSNYKLFVLLAPHISNHGSGNTGWVDHYKGMPMIFAERNNALALACSVPWKNASVGFVGTSDGWQDLKKHKQMHWQYKRAENGNIAMVAEINLKAAQDNDNEIIVAVGFGRCSAEAGQRARGSIVEGFDNAKKLFIEEWQEWQKDLFNYKSSRKSPNNLYKISTSVLRTHESKRHPGGFIASLSVPWGFARGDEDIGGYHLVWPRDLYHTAGGLLAAKAGADATRVLNYLMVTQEDDGHWPQNMWMDGFPYWTGVQMDQVGSPILLVDLASREGIIETSDLKFLWPMVRKAASYIIAHGSTTDQCRWEENAGYTPYTLAIEIAALLIAADFAEVNKQPKLAEYLRETADFWNESIERWIYVKDTPIARSVGVEGYYIRVAPTDDSEGYFHSPVNADVYLANRPEGESSIKACELVSVDALALVRFGLRDANDPKILNTIKVIDAFTKVDFETGPCWYRYNEDGYGEHADGSPYDGLGFGRPWPFLTGERAHYEIAAGNFKGAEKLLKTMESFANEGGMLPEQIWDGEDIPEKELYFGKPTGSAMPLAWAHAEYLKLCRSIKIKQVFDMPHQTRERYIEEKTISKYHIFRFSTKFKSMPQGKVLRIETFAPTTVKWTVDDWETSNKTNSWDSEIGMYVTDLNTESLKKGTEIIFTFFWDNTQNWEGEDFEVKIT